MTRLPRLAAPLAALALAAALAGCGDDEPTRADETSTPAGGSTTPATESTTPATGTTAPTSESTTPGDERSVPAYFVGDTPQGPRLFREDGTAAGADDLSAALALAESTPADPDYRTALEQGAVSSVALDGTGGDRVIAVTLRKGSWVTRPPGMSAAEAELAVQQLVYTLQAAAGGDAGPVRAPVEFSTGGSETTFLGIASGVTAAPQTKVLAFVNVLTPAEGQTVSGDTLQAQGLADSFEANVPWQVLDASGSEVLDGSSTAGGWGTRLFPWSTSVDVSDLPPGDYTFVASTDDPSDGEGGGPTQDTKAFTIP